MIDLTIRPRRNRRNNSIRRMVRETLLSPADLIWPLFVIDGDHEEQPIAAMPDCFRWSRDRIVTEAKEAYARGIPAIALFPVLDETLKDSMARASTDPDGLLQKTVRDLKATVPDLCVITDVAMDPYSSDGHDGIVKDGVIVNDPTLEVLAAMAVSQAEAGADIVAPSDMMDGRVAAIRAALDANGYPDTGILSYSVKYASGFYGPFRQALDSEPREGDKKTYQMDPANAREALREAALDIDEGADIIMVKPALPYLDVLSMLASEIDLPLAAYQVSGEYAMLKAAGKHGWLDYDSVMRESLLCIKRAGADMIFSYAAFDISASL